jgi:hypothetical protein
MKKNIFILLSLNWLPLFVFNVNAAPPVANVAADVSPAGKVTLSWNRFANELPNGYREENGYVYEFMFLSMEISNDDGDYESLFLSWDHDAERVFVLDSIKPNVQYNARVWITYDVYQNSPPSDFKSEKFGGSTATFSLGKAATTTTTYIHTDILGSPVAESH